MPAASEPSTPPLPRTYRPLGPRIVGFVVVVVLFTLCGVTWAVSFTAKTRAQFSALEIATLLLIGAGIVAIVYALGRSRVTATAGGLVVVNGYRKRTFAWQEVVAIRLPSGAPWATLDLDNGTSCSAMGIQGSDGARARAAVRELRALLAARSV